MGYCHTYKTIIEVKCSNDGCNNIIPTQRNLKGLRCLECREKQYTQNKKERNKRRLEKVARY